MSRSFKKSPCCPIASKDETAKKRFNRRIRRTMKIDDIPDGAAYRKLNDSYDISDGKFKFESRVEFMEFRCGILGEDARTAAALYRRDFVAK